MLVMKSESCRCLSLHFSTFATTVNKLIFKDGCEILLSAYQHIRYGQKHILVDFMSAQTMIFVKNY